MGNKLNFLKTSINARIAGIDSRRVYYRRQSFLTFMATSILSVTTAILLGLKIKELEEIVRITALIIAALITLITAYSAFFNNKELWVANNNARNRFFKLKFDIEFAEQEPEKITDAVLEQFKTSYQEILDDLNATWQKNRLSNK